ncbi:MAG: GNAT family N-acetyltransferase [Planctomycetota bacterium]|nr:GNAT family N-acetyltransferase [Planctomycetota bacterium]MDA1211343.1 GNAT family N-acetyltransferase [Planctomycetota bacterium]
MSDTIIIRTYRHDDLEMLRELTIAAFDGASIDQGIEREYGEINGKTWQWRKGRHVDVDVKRDPDGVFIAEVNGRIVGAISSWRDTEAGIGHIPNLLVIPDYQGHGLGRRLIRHVIEHFHKHDLTHAKIETLATNDVGNHLYPKLGFREVARQVHFVGPVAEMLAD